MTVLGITTNIIDIIIITVTINIIFFFHNSYDHAYQKLPVSAYLVVGSIAITVVKILLSINILSTVNVRCSTIIVGVAAASCMDSSTELV